MCNLWCLFSTACFLLILISHQLFFILLFSLTLELSPEYHWRCGHKKNCWRCPGSCYRHGIITHQSWYRQLVDLHDEFYKIFINRLNVQFEQVFFGKIRESNRFTVLHNLKDTFGKSKYIDVIRNADIRLIFTQLRSDLNVLKTCKINTDINKNCPYGCNEQETVAHLLIRCRKFDEARSEFVSLWAIPRYKLSNGHYMLKYILDLECPGNLVNACCRFISKVYNSRKKLRP